MTLRTSAAQGPGSPPRSLARCQVSSRIESRKTTAPSCRDRAVHPLQLLQRFRRALGGHRRSLPEIERVLVEDNEFHWKVRFPVAATYGSRQDIDAREQRADGDRTWRSSAKQTLFRTDQFPWPVDMGVSIPTADDTLCKHERHRDRASEIRKPVQIFKRLPRCSGDFAIWTGPQALTCNWDLAAPGPRSRLWSTAKFGLNPIETEIMQEIGVF